MQTESLQALAPAKLNLFLHITGKRADGYHLLESLVVFVNIGDRITLSPANETSLTISGPFSEGLSTSDNLILKAHQALQTHLSTPINAHIHLEKNLPVGAGIGGGSSDAAATLKLLCALHNITLPENTLQEIALPLGSDIPACYYAKPAILSGIGEHITPYTLSEELHLVLVNPRIPLLTAKVYQHFQGSFRTPVLPTNTPLQTLLEQTSNDLEEPACALMPEIKNILQTIQNQPGCTISRMSGSGATCFGLFTNETTAKAAATNISNHHPHWWVQYGETL